MNYEKNCMSYWFPRLAKAKVYTPPTAMFDMNKINKNFDSAIKNVFWMKELTIEEKSALTQFMSLLRSAAKNIGYPLFLRTGQTSHKHSWLETCYVADEKSLIQHAQNLAEYSIMVNMEGGLPINVWVLRALIKTEPIFVAFDGFPITREMRFFFKDHKIICKHPYWPEEALEKFVNEDGWKEKLAKMNKLDPEEDAYLTKLTEQVMQQFDDGYYSIDWLQAKDGRWFAIDMATGEDSYHWPDCKNK